MSNNKNHGRSSLLTVLNKSESDLRELAGQQTLQQELVLKLLNGHEEEQLLDLFDLSSGPDYCYSHQLLTLLWSYKNVAEDCSMPDDKYQQAIDTVLFVSQNIIDNWPSLTPKKVSRLGTLVKEAATIARTK